MNFAPGLLDELLQVLGQGARGAGARCALAARKKIIASRAAGIILLLRRDGDERCVRRPFTGRGRWPHFGRITRVDARRLSARARPAAFVFDFAADDIGRR